VHLEVLSAREPIVDTWLWKTMPIDRRTWDGCFATSNPLTIAVPEVIVRIVDNIESVVVFPAPFGPSNPKTSP